MSNTIYTPKHDYKVLVCCFTYNQSKYIEDALNGFAMQQTEFPFVCLVMDDCSTDGEQEVIKAWMERECDMVKAEYIDIELSNVIIVPHKSNTSCTFAFYFLKQNLYSSDKKKMNMVYPWRECCEYEAICEGDDYWIDPEKLQKQAEYMDEHRGCVYLFTDRYIDNTKQGIRQETRYQRDKYTTRDIMSGFIPGLQTVIFRIDMLTSPVLNTTGINGDRLYAYAASLSGEVHCLHDITAVYRNTGEGVSTGVRQDVFFNHVVRDMMTFHKNLNSHDIIAYCKGQSINLGTYGAGKSKWRRLMGVYSAFRSVDRNFTFGMFLITLFFFLERKIKSTCNWCDPKVKNYTISKKNNPNSTN